MKFADSFRAARWVRLINLLLQAVLFLTLFGGLNYVALNHAWRFDLTQSRRHSLSAETRSYLEQLDRNVQIIVTIPKDNTEEELNQAYRDISGLLREYAYVTRNNPKGKVEVRYLDVYQNRKDTEALGLDTPNQVVLISDRGRSVLTLGDFYQTRGGHREGFRGEATLTAALLDVSSPQKKKIYFLAGHGEMRPEDVDRRRGLSGIRDELRARNYEIASLPESQPESSRRCRPHHRRRAAGPPPALRGGAVPQLSQHPRRPAHSPAGLWRFPRAGEPALRLGHHRPGRCHLRPPPRQQHGDQ